MYHLVAVYLHEPAGVPGMHSLLAQRMKPQGLCRGLMPVPLWARLDVRAFGD